MPVGVVGPSPGTPLYEDHHERFGFSDWWLRAEYAAYEPFPPVADQARWRRHYVDDASLTLDFFRYSDAMRDVIRAALRMKGEHNLRQLGWLRKSRGGDTT